MGLNPCQLNKLPGALHLKQTLQPQPLQTLRLINRKKVSKSGSLQELRTELLSINGVGKETADSMILYAANKPIFVVDAYTRRVLERHGIAGPEADYDGIQAIFHRNLKEDVAMFNDYHAQFVAVGSNYCSGKARCSGCPLEGM